MYSDLFDFDLIFSKWNRPIKEVNGYKILDTEKGKLIVVNALGISKKDLNVEIVKNTLIIEGKTEVKEIDFTNSVRFEFDISKVKDRLESIDYELKNGLVFVNLNIHIEPEKEIKISCK